MAQYSIAQVIDKTLYPNDTLKVYDLPDGKVIGTVSAPNPAGVVYSWVTGKDGAIWWMFDARKSGFPHNSLGTYYIKQEPGSFNVKALRQQGAITVKEEIALEKEKNKDTLSRITDIVKWLGLTIAGAIVVKAVIKK